MTAGNNDTSHAHPSPVLTCDLGQAHASTQVLNPCVRLGLDSNALVDSALLTDLKRTTGSNALYLSQAIPCTCCLSPFSPRIAKPAVYLHKGCNTSLISRLVVAPLESLIIAKQGRWTDKPFFTLGNPPHYHQVNTTLQAIDRTPNHFVSLERRLASSSPALAMRCYTSAYSLRDSTQVSFL
jgi:hypothetical protein